MKNEKSDIIEKSQKQMKRFWTNFGVIALVIAAVLISLLFYKQKIEIEVPKEVKILQQLTSDWKPFYSEKYKFALKHPENWEIQDGSTKTISQEDPTIQYILNSTAEDKNKIKIRISDNRKIAETAEDSIQTSMPFDKRNYIIFSTSLDNDQKILFYNMIATLELNKNNNK